MTELPERSLIKLNPAQIAVLEWIKDGCPPGVYPDNDFAHRITARALANRALVRVAGHGASWRAEPMERGRVWPEPTEHDKRPTPLNQPPETPTAVTVDDEHIGATARAMRRVRAKRTVSPATKRPVKQVQKQETYMRYKVMVTRVQVAERWVRATDEEDAARKVQEEFDRPFGYFGSWKTTASEVEVVEAEQTKVIRPHPLSDSGPILLSLKDAGTALGIPYSAVYELTNRGDIEHTKIGSRKYISRDSLMAFIKENTHRGYSG
ncbi:helix-turn-helix domain-containing protein [Leifsonia sp. McL0607]|uniref:helix-turn-helix domain-containing protein n=1 Tax=Leifsonia sp. McL0607 TaxID=3415672 RepID=UPI003CECF832